MPAPDHLNPPASPNLSRWGQMGPRERAKAAWLALDAGWDVDLPSASGFDTDTNTVIVLGPGSGGTQTWGVCTKSAEEYLARIGEKFGDKALARVREVIAIEGLPATGDGVPW